MALDESADSRVFIDRDVVVTPYGERYHRLPRSSTARLKDAACGGFRGPNLMRISQSEALENGYTPCQVCDWHSA